MDPFDKAIEQELAKHEVNTRLKTAPCSFCQALGEKFYFRGLIQPSSIR